MATDAIRTRQLSAGRLRSHLEAAYKIKVAPEHDYPAERCAAPEPVSASGELLGQRSVLVTGHIGLELKWNDPWRK